MGAGWDSNVGPTKWFRDDRLPLLARVATSPGVNWGTEPGLLELLRHLPRLDAAIDAGGGAEKSPAKHCTISCTIPNSGG